MKLSVDYPSIAFREGPAKAKALASAIESIGYDDIAVYDHVVMGHPTDTRPAARYPATMPILEAIVLLATIAAVTERATLSTEVLVLPQRSPTLVAKQISTIDTLSGGRVRLGVGVGWQESEYEALGFDFSTRGRRMDDAIDTLRSYWGDASVDVTTADTTSIAMAMEPKPDQGANLPIWIGGGSKAARQRVATKGDGWMGMPGSTDEATVAMVADIRARAEAADRDPDALGWQMMIQPPPVDPDGRSFYADHDRVVRRAVELQEMGFGWLAINATAIFQAGARSIDAMVDDLGRLHGSLRAAVG